MEILKPLAVRLVGGHKAQIDAIMTASGLKQTFCRRYYTHKTERLYSVIVAGVRVFFDRNCQIVKTALAYETIKTAPADSVEAQEAPKPAEAEQEQEAEVLHAKTAQIEKCLQLNIPVFLVGPAGSGKNYTVEQICKRNGWDFYMSNSVQQEFKLTGFIDAGGRYHETEFYKACTCGKKCVFFLDELDASTPEVLVLLNAAIANKYFVFPTGRVDFGESVLFVAAGNTCGQGASDLYTGRFALDQSTLDRFAQIAFDYDPQIEESLTSNNVELLEFVRVLRGASQAVGVRAVFSYRCLTMAAKLQAAGMQLSEIVEIAIFRGMSEEDIKGLLNCDQFFGMRSNCWLRAAWDRYNTK